MGMVEGLTEPTRSPSLASTWGEAMAIGPSLVGNQLSIINMLTGTDRSRREHPSPIRVIDGGLDGDPQPLGAGLTT